jgi:pyruvate dehydrogenase E2 component (dihydrolipoamide acetyltransferase)
MPLEVGAIWRRMAERTTQSWQTAPHFYLLREVDASRLEAWRASTRKRAGYERVTHTDLLVKLAAAALREHPHVNGHWREGGIVAAEEVNVDDGLVVPVVHGADRLELREIAASREELVQAARTGKLRPQDLGGGTFTISNLGMYGVDAFSAVLNGPQAAILAVGRIADRVAAIDRAPEVRPMCTLTVSFDHASSTERAPHASWRHSPTSSRNRRGWCPDGGDGRASARSRGPRRYRGSIPAWRPLPARRRRIR